MNIKLANALDWLRRGYGTRKSSLYVMDAPVRRLDLVRALSPENVPAFLLRRRRARSVAK